MSTNNTVCAIRRDSVSYVRWHDYEYTTRFSSNESPETVLRHLRAFNPDLKVVLRDSELELPVPDQENRRPKAPADSIPKADSASEVGGTSLD